MFQINQDYNLIFNNNFWNQHKSIEKSEMEDILNSHLNYISLSINSIVFSNTVTWFIVIFEIYLCLPRGRLNDDIRKGWWRCLMYWFWMGETNININHVNIPEEQNILIMYPKIIMYQYLLLVVYHINSQLGFKYLCILFSDTKFSIQNHVST